MPMGLISRIDGVVSSHGTTVSHASLLPVIEKLHALATRGMASSDNLSALDPSALSYAQDASGAV